MCFIEMVASRRKNVGLDPKVWGPHSWFSMHCITLAYPDHPSPDEQVAAYDHFMSYKYLLPCAHCKAHFAEHLDSTKLAKAVQSKDGLVSWLVDFHNKVNQSLGKSTFSCAEAVRYFRDQFHDPDSARILDEHVYDDETTTDDSPKKTRWGSIIIAILVIALGTLVGHQLTTMLIKCNC